MNTMFHSLEQQILELSQQKKGAITVIGIDGPTASGKTMLTNKLIESLVAQNKSVFAYRMDWSLEQRAKRVADLTVLKSAEGAFTYEAELHMRLDRPQQFLEQVTRYNESGETTAREIVLENLYSREKNGELCASTRCVLEPGLIILIEGHYTLRTELDDMIDLNILLLADHQELLERKINRVQGYRGVEEATDYFWRIDIPSFDNHLLRFRLNADVIVDNSNYLEPKLAGQELIIHWRNSQAVSRGEAGKKQDLVYGQLARQIFSTSSLVSGELSTLVELAVQSVVNWDSSVGRYLRTSIEQLDADLETLAEQALNGLNFHAQESHYEFRLSHNDSLYNVYHRKLPLSLGIGIYDKFEDVSKVELLADVFQNELVLKVFWDGGYKILAVSRKLGEIAKAQEYKICDITSESGYGNLLKTESIQALVPTDFTIPSFLKHMQYERVLIGKENEVISASFGVDKILREGGVWVHRFALFSELRFFATLLRRAGVHSVQAGNYLICVRLDSTDVRREFKKFKKQWSRKLSKKELFAIAEAQADLLVQSERTRVKQTVNMCFRHFSMKDGNLFSRFMFGSEVDITEALKELKAMMLSPIRLLRKRAYQFVGEFIPSLALKTRDLWSNLDARAADEITLENLHRLGPSIMAEVYLWLTLRDEPASVLGANIYDVRSESLDARAYLSLATDRSAPVLLQSSLNAIGQKENTDTGREVVGYLQPLGGPEDFVQVCLKEARDLFLNSGKLPPLYGIGLDHVAANFDSPPGRARRFLERMLRTGRLTHVVLDGAALFEAHSLKDEDLSKAYYKMSHFAVGLLGRAEDYWLLDKEICAGELNYIENEKSALIPSANQMRLFMEQFQEAIKERGQLIQLSRPMLFIGNLGTTHHGRDTEIPKVEKGLEWRDELKGENFVSPVLHGTTNSHSKVLSSASHGCHKINIAGNFLQVMVDHLPQQLSQFVYESKAEAKRLLPELRSQMNLMSEAEDKVVVEALRKSCEGVMDVIRSPRLSSNDNAYFSYQSFSLEESQIDVIIRAIQEKINSKYEPAALALADSRERRHFSASMIEVPLEDIRGGLTDNLWSAGVRYFHIDAGDGKFVTRQFCGLEKARYLRDKFPEAKLHAHLMIENPHQASLGQISAIQSYARAGCNAIAIHERAITDKTDLIEILQFIRSLGCRPGLILETTQIVDQRLRNIIDKADLDWSVLMGVPVGYGGQLFQYNTLNRIKAFYQFARERKRDFLIEVDGGLTPETIRLCALAGAQIFAGWSVIKAPSNELISAKLSQVHRTLDSLSL